MANTFQWNTGSGTWTNAADWTDISGSTLGPPASADSAEFGFGIGSGTITGTGVASWMDVENGTQPWFFSGVNLTLGGMTVGDNGPGVMTFDNSSNISSGYIHVGQNNSSNGSLTVNATTIITATLGGGIGVGQNTGAVGSLSLQAGGTITNNGTSTTIGNAGNGTLNVSGTGALLNGTAGLIIGNTGTGVATVGNGGVINAGSLEVGQLAGSNGSLTIQFGGTVIDGGSYTWVGSAAGSTGSITIQAGGTLTDNSGSVFVGGGGAAVGSNGTLTVNGTGATLNGTANLYVGEGGNGQLVVKNGASAEAFTSNSATKSALAVGPQATGLVTLDGAGSSLALTGGAALGSSGTGTLNITSGAAMSIGVDATGNSYLTIGAQSGTVLGGTGYVTVDGTGSSLIVASSGTNKSVGNVNVGFGQTTGNLSVTNNGSVEAHGRLLVGVADIISSTTYSGTGRMTIASGGVVQVDGNNTDVVSSGSTTFASGIVIGVYAGDSGTLRINAGGTLAYLAVGDAAPFGLDIGFSAAGAGLSASYGQAFVSGAGALLNMGSNAIVVGYSGNGLLAISQGGTVTSGTSSQPANAAVLGNASSGVGTLLPPPG